MSILELGAAENSYLPPNLKPNKHIGVGAISSQMESNPSITKSYVIDLNTVIEDEGIDSKVFNEEIIGEGGGGQFDAILTARMNNLLNTEFISDAQDGSGNGLPDTDPNYIAPSSARAACVYYGFGRTFSVGAKIKF